MTYNIPRGICCIYNPYSFWTADCSIWSSQDASLQNTAGTRLPEGCPVRWCTLNVLPRVVLVILLVLLLTGELSPNLQILRSASGLCNQLPVLDRDVFDSNFHSVCVWVHVFCINDLHYIPAANKWSSAGVISCYHNQGHSYSQWS